MQGEIILGGSPDISSHPTYTHSPGACYSGAVRCHCLHPLRVHRVKGLTQNVHHPCWITWPSSCVNLNSRRLNGYQSGLHLGATLRLALRLSRIADTGDLLSLTDPTKVSGVPAICLLIVSGNRHPKEVASFCGENVGELILQLEVFL